MNRQAATIANSASHQSQTLSRVKLRKKKNRETNDGRRRVSDGIVFPLIEVCLYNNTLAEKN